MNLFLTSVFNQLQSAIVNSTHIKIPVKRHRATSIKQFWVNRIRVYYISFMVYDIRLTPIRECWTKIRKPETELPSFWKEKPRSELVLLRLWFEKLNNLSKTQGLFLWSKRNLWKRTFKFDYQLRTKFWFSKEDFPWFQHSH